MKTGQEILAAFTGERPAKLLVLQQWAFEKLKELKARYAFDYKYSQANHIKYRIDLLEEAMECKRGNEKQAWDSLT